MGNSHESRDIFKPAVSGVTWLYRTLNRSFVFKGLNSRLSCCMKKKNGKHELERLKKQNTNKKHLKCIKTKNKPRKQMEPAILLHLHVLGSFLLLGKRRYFSRLKISVVLYLQGFQQAAATL